MSKTSDKLTDEIRKEFPLMHKEFDEIRERAKQRDLKN